MILVLIVKPAYGITSNSVLNIALMVKVMPIFQNEKKITSDKHLYLSENSNNDKISVASTADTSDPFSACSSYFCKNEEDRSPLSRHNNNTSSAIPPPLPCVFFSQKDKVHASALAA
mmetsp:Transcript_2483/g.2838  ORF Transcript_2483/g.2838 Transcript_2483/m.2838 type:complete len:117 (+) Transcript_2483:773-1123(+)